MNKQTSKSRPNVKLAANRVRGTKTGVRAGKIVWK